MIVLKRKQREVMKVTKKIIKSDKELNFREKFISIKKQKEFKSTLCDFFSSPWVYYEHCSFKGKPIRLRLHTSRKGTRIT